MLKIKKTVNIDLFQIILKIEDGLLPVSRNEIEVKYPPFVEVETDLHWSLSQQVQELRVHFNYNQLMSVHQ